MAILVLALASKYCHSLGRNQDLGLVGVALGVCLGVSAITQQQSDPVAPSQKIIKNKNLQYVILAYFRQVAKAYLLYQYAIGLM